MCRKTITWTPLPSPCLPRPTLDFALLQVLLLPQRLSLCKKSTPNSMTGTYTWIQMLHACSFTVQQISHHSKNYNTGTWHIHSYHLDLLQTLTFFFHQWTCLYSIRLHKNSHSLLYNRWVIQLLIANGVILFLLRLIVVIIALLLLLHFRCAGFPHVRSMVIDLPKEGSFAIQ